MDKALAGYRKITGLLARIILSIAAITIGLDVLSIFSEAVGRYLLGHSRAFMEELPRLAIPIVVFPMMGVLLRLGKHIFVDLLPGSLRGRARSLVLVTVYTAVIAISILFITAGVIAIDHYKKMGLETQTEIIFKTWITYLPFPIGFGLLALFAVELLWQELLNLFRQAGSGK